MTVNEQARPPRLSALARIKRRRPCRINGPAEVFDASADGVRRDAMGYGINSVNIHTRYRTYIVGAITDKDRHLRLHVSDGVGRVVKDCRIGRPFLPTRSPEHPRGRRLRYTPVNPGVLQTHQDEA